MKISEVVYLGNLRTSAKHIKTGQTILCDAPTDNQGKGEAFSPTDLVCTMLASCILTIIGIVSFEHGFSIDGTRANIAKIMYDKPRRIGEIHIDFHFPEHYPEKIRKIIEKTVSTCPVSKSLHPEIKQIILYHYA